jgi:hypothetical protein
VRHVDDDDEKGEWYRGGHDGQKKEAGELMELDLRLRGCINLLRPSWMIAAESLDRVEWDS